MLRFLGLFGRGDLEGLRLVGGGDFEVPFRLAGGVIDRAVYLKVKVNTTKKDAQCIESIETI
jgi:hypothetical protein